MPIEFACPQCQKKYRLKDELAGKTAKCAKCNHRIKIPDPAAAALASEPNLENWLGDELASEAAKTPVAERPTSSRPANKPCTSCGASLPGSAVVCNVCGFDFRKGKKLSKGKVKKTSKSRVGSAARASASLARGALFSAIGAALGAAVWVGVVIATDYEIGWIAWGLGAAAGAGMAMGHQDKDGSMAGIVAAGISILGILAAKLFVFEHLKSQLAELGLSLAVLGERTGETFTFTSVFGPIDGLFILLAVCSAYKIGSGQASD